MIFAVQEKTTGVCGFSSGLLGTICNEKKKKRALKRNSWTVCLYGSIIVLFFINNRKI